MLAYAGNPDPAVRTSRLAWPVVDSELPFLHMFFERPHQPYNDDDLRAIKGDLDEVWQADDWRRRLRPFIEVLHYPKAVRAFADLVAKGCQPDYLAEKLYRSVVPKSDEAVVHARELRSALLKEVQAASERVSELRMFEVQEWGNTGVPPEWITYLGEMLRGLTPRDEPRDDDEPLRGPATHPQLLFAADHVKEVTGTAHYEQLCDIINAVRGSAKKSRLRDSESLEKTIKRARRRMKEWRQFRERRFARQPRDEQFERWIYELTHPNASEEMVYDAMEKARVERREHDAGRKEND